MIVLSFNIRIWISFSKIFPFSFATQSNSIQAFTSIDWRRRVSLRLMWTKQQIEQTTMEKQKQTTPEKNRTNVWNFKEIRTRQNWHEINWRCMFGCSDESRWKCSNLALLYYIKWRDCNAFVHKTRVNVFASGSQRWILLCDKCSQG